MFKMIFFTISHLQLIKVKVCKNGEHNLDELFKMKSKNIPCKNTTISNLNVHIQDEIHVR